MPTLVAINRLVNPTADAMHAVGAAIQNFEDLDVRDRPHQLILSAKGHDLFEFELRVPSDTRNPRATGQINMSREGGAIVQIAVNVGDEQGEHRFSIDLDSLTAYPLHAPAHRPTNPRSFKSER